MKRKLALLILLILALTVALAACGSKEKTDISPRWLDEEQLTYNITKADFSGKDRYMNGELSLNDLDEIEPENVSGTYTLKIERSTANVCTITTEQELFVQYNKAKLSDMDYSSVLVENADMFAEVENIETVVLRSTARTKVEFKNESSQQPISSVMEIHGFYVGKRHMEVSGYKVETTYDWDSKRPTANVSVTLDGETKATTYEKKFNRNSAFIDSNQLITYVRSLDKPSDGFQDNPSVMAFNPYTRETSTIAFAMNSGVEAQLTDSTHGTITGKVDVVTVTIGGTYYMQQFNVPNLLSKDVDVVHGTSNKPKYTTVRFRIGFISYELAQYDNDVWSALQPATKPAE